MAMPSVPPTARQTHAHVLSLNQAQTSPSIAATASPASASAHAAPQTVPQNNIAATQQQQQQQQQQQRPPAMQQQQARPAGGQQSGAQVPAGYEMQAMLGNMKERITQLIPQQTASLQQQQMQQQQNHQSFQSQMQAQNQEMGSIPAPSGKGKKSADKDDDGNDRKTDVETMMDVTTYGGVDIREEEDMMTNVPSRVSLKPANPLGVDRSHMQSLVNIPLLKGMMDNLAHKQAQTSITPHAPLKIPTAPLEYMSQALEQRLQILLEQTIRAAKHRSGIHQHQFILAAGADAVTPGPSSDINSSVNVKEDPDSGAAVATAAAPTRGRKPAVAAVVGKAVDVRIVGDVKLILAAMEKYEKGSESKEKVALHPDGKGKSAAEMRGDDGAGGADGEGFDDGTGTGKKRKKGPGGGKKDVSESVKTKQTNSTANAIAAGKKGFKSWMVQGGAAGVGVGDANSANGGQAGRKKRKTKGEGEEAPLDYSDLTGVGMFDGGEGSLEGKRIHLGRTMNAKEMCRVTLKDAVFVMEKEPQMRTSALLCKWIGRIS
ncbi:transcription initiation factor TFIID component TAF4 family-domain-containing protein [Chytriomyces cf. hyalinus JEL632]|nr:transcription initiation factor TFIID component TAF4 family-domain-containing protein [Chytriomyces cf. hyalinus JEL632]